MNDISITWETSGRPRLLDPAAPQSELSISHDGDLGMAVVGTGPQGCDVQAVERRGRGDWEALLGVGRAGLLDALIASGDTLDQAGTRVWATVEAGIKALGAPVPKEIRVVGQEGAGILLEVDHSLHGAWQVFTSLVSLEPGRDHVVAMGLPTEPRTLLALVPEPQAAPEPEREAEAGQESEPEPEPSRPVLRSLSLVPAQSAQSAQSAAPSHSGTQAAHVQTFPVLVRDVPKALGAVHFSSYVSWTGASREEAMRGVMARLESDLNANVGKFVATTLSLACTAPATVGDRITVALGASALNWEQGPYTFGWDFHRGDVDGPLVARATMQAVWIRPVAPNKYGVGAPPAYLRDEVYRLAAPALIPAPAADVELLGDLLVKGDPGESFAEATCEIPIALDDTDFQGHANFTNYFRWQGVARDVLLRSIGVPIMGGDGTPTCLSSETKYIREVLAFDRIRASAQVVAVYEHGLDVKLSFDRLTESGAVGEKVALGRHLLALTRRGRSGEQIPVPLPAATLKACGLAQPLLARAA
jgi:acyl-CoA thioesterase FadM/phosphopantetheinyl transferase (holo-ACP synthase)